MSDIMVKSSELTHHASHVDSIGDLVATARDGANTATLGISAYGHLLTFVVGWFHDMEHDLTDKYSEMVTGQHSDAGNLRSAAAGYDHSDEHAKTATRAVAAKHSRIALPL
jgi:hypothetical protein